MSSFPGSILSARDSSSLPSPSFPVTGRDGVGYLSIAAAIAGQVEDTVAFLPQPGTTSNVLVGTAALSAVDDFYKDYYAVYTGLSPFEGQVLRAYRVSKYIGATRTATLDGPFPLSAVTTGLITVSAGVLDGETVTISDGVNPASVFEFDTNGVVVPGNIPVRLDAVTFISQVREQLAAAIMNRGALLNVKVRSTTGGGVRLINYASGTLGAVAMSDTVVDPAFMTSGMTLWSAGEVTLVREVGLQLNVDLTEDLTGGAAISKSVNIDLQGHRLRGKVDIAAGVYHHIHGGYITNGIRRTTNSYLKITGSTVSRRDEEIYAILTTEAATRSRVDLDGCEIRGVYASRVAFRTGGKFEKCTNPASDDAFAGVPWRFIEATAGINLALEMADFEFHTEASGACLFVEDGSSITYTDPGAASFGCYLSIMGEIYAQKYSHFTVPALASRRFCIFKQIGTGVMSGAGIGGLVALRVGVIQSNLASKFGGSDSYFAAIQFSLWSSQNSIAPGGGGYNIGSPEDAWKIVLEHVQVAALMTIEGSVTCTANISCSSSARVYFDCRAQDTMVIGMDIGSPVTGPPTIGHAVRIFGGSWTGCLVRADQVTGAPTVTCNMAVEANYCVAVRVALLGNLIVQSVGTWTFLGSITLRGVSFYNGLTIGFGFKGGTVTWSGGVAGSVVQVFTHAFRGGSGGMVTASGTVNVEIAGLAFTIGSHAGTSGDLLITGAINISMLGITGSTQTIASHTGTGGTNTVSSATIRISGIQAARLLIASASGAGGTAGASGNLFVNGFRFQIADELVTATVAGGTANFTGTATFDRCTWEAAFTALNAVLGATVSGPTAITFTHCTFSSTWTDATGAGVITWAGASLRSDFCFFGGLLTFVGTRFALVEASEDRFDATPISVSTSGVLPAVYRCWKCSARGKTLGLFAEAIDDFITIAAIGALGAGNLCRINALGEAVGALAGSHVEGVLLIATAAPGDPAVLVRRGAIWVDSAMTVVAGDSGVLDPAVPTQQITGVTVPGQRISRALEATGATPTHPGEAYSIVNLA